MCKLQKININVMAYFHSIIIINSIMTAQLTQIVSFIQREDVRQLARAVIDTPPLKVGNLVIIFLSVLVVMSTTADDFRRLGRRRKLTEILSNFTLIITLASVCSGLAYALAGEWTIGYGMAAGVIGGIVSKKSEKWKKLLGYRNERQIAQ